MAHILIIGQKFSTLTDYLTTHGHTFTLIQDILKTKFPDKRFKNRIVADFSSKDTLLSSLKQLKTKPDGVMVTYESYVLPAAWIAEYLHLPGIPTIAAEACTDKFLMRSLFAMATEKVSPDFKIAESEESIIEFANSHSFPIIMKPANLAKSLLVTKSNTIEDLITQYRDTIKLLDTTYKKYAPNRTPKVIIEEYLDGTIHSVDAFVDSLGKPHILEQVVDYQTGYDIGYDDNFHYSRLLPSALPVSDINDLRHCAEVGIRALGMKSSAAHVEIIMTSKGPRIVEIGARNGGYRERMHSLANGIDITGAALALSLGQQPEITATCNDSCAVLELFPKTAGIFNGINCIDELKSLASLNYLSIKAKEGADIGKAAQGYKMSAVVILHSDDSDLFANDLNFLNTNVYVKTQ
jgi:carbamoylphosphate synthase large subunit